MLFVPGVLLGIFSDTAQGFGCNAEIRGDHVLRYTQYEVWILFKKVQVLLLGGKAHGGVQAVLIYDKTLFEYGLYHRIEGGDLLAELIKVFFAYEDNLAILEGVDVGCGGVSGKKAFAIACPPVFGCKVKDVLGSFVIYAIRAKTAVAYKCMITPHVARLQKVLMFTQCLQYAYGPDACVLVFCERCPAGDIGFEDVEHIVGCEFQRYDGSHTPQKLRIVLIRCIYAAILL